jgi:hypothetical protein
VRDQPFSHLLEQGVTGLASETVVEVAEALEIGNANSKLPANAFGVPDELSQAVEK